VQINKTTIIKKKKEQNSNFKLMAKKL